MRGEHRVRRQVDDVGLGIIPACAGNTTAPRVSAPASWDHPRIRGEHRRNGFERSGILGSSPHTRGTQSTGRSASRTPWDHPRIRGEHLDENERLAGVAGIIPAYAGNTLCALATMSQRSGSSPHTRGTHSLDAGTARLNGIIPAYAGNTHEGETLDVIGVGSSPHTRGTLRSKGYKPIITQDHPRIRGEHFLFTSSSTCWGRIIPAYAGNTVQAFRRCLCCGGSSPHTRGTRRSGVARLFG